MDGSGCLEFLKICSEKKGIVENSLLLASDTDSVKQAEVFNHKYTKLTYK